MAFFKRKKDTEAKKAPQNSPLNSPMPSASTASTDLDEAWAQLEFAATQPAQSSDTGGIGDRAFVNDDLKRYQEMDLSAELGGLPTEDATPGMIDVDVDALLDGVAEMPIAPAAVATTPAPQPAPRTATPTRAAAPLTNETAAQETSATGIAAEDFSFNVPPAPARDGRADLSTMRLDVARIASDIQSGEELYRRAQKRIENLTGFVERAELDFSMLNRLEPENRRLKARNRTLESEIDDAKRKLDVMRADLDDHRRRLAERTAVLEQLHSKMSVAQKSLQDYERVLGATRQQSDKHALAAERSQTSLDVERRENQVLREKVTDLTAQLDTKSTQTLETQKMMDSLRQDTVDFRAQAEGLGSENIELRNALDHAQRANNQMKGEMVSLHEDIRNFKTQSEFTVIAREDEMSALKAQVDELRKQLEIKDEIVRNAARDVQELRKIRTSQDLERERLESIIETQSFQLDEAGTRLIEAQASVTDFDRRYRDVAAALNQQQMVRQQQAPAAVPDIAPEVPSESPIKPATLKDLGDDLSDDDIEARIADLTLGLRSSS